MSRKLMVLSNRGNFVNKPVFLCSALSGLLDETLRRSQKFKSD